MVSPPGGWRDRYGFDEVEPDAATSARPVRGRRVAGGPVASLAMRAASTKIGPAVAVLVLFGVPILWATRGGAPPAVPGRAAVLLDTCVVVPPRLIAEAFGDPSFSLTATPTPATESDAGPGCVLAPPPGSPPSAASVRLTVDRVPAAAGDVVAIDLGDDGALLFSVTGTGDDRAAARAAKDVAASLLGPND